MPSNFHPILALLCLLLPFTTFSSPIAPAEKDGPSLLIATGSAASPKEFPWLVSLHWSQGHFCSGVIISPNSILTSAQCLELTHYYYMDVYAGLYKLSENATEGVQKKAGLLGTILKLHHAFFGVQNDIALINLPANSPFQFDEFVQAIPFDMDVSPLPEPEIGSEGVIAGWGSDAEASITLQETLMKANVTFLEGTECEGLYGPDFNSTTMLCVGEGVDGGNFCNGDLGTPLMGNHPNGSYYLAGIASWGEGCAEKPGVYTKISAFIDWIKENYIG